MADWTDIANGDIDQDSPGTQTLFTALRENPIAIAESSSGAPINQAAWHPYNALTVGDGNDGVYYDHSVDGDLTTIDSPEFVDGYEYMVSLVDMTGSGGTVGIVRVSVQRSSDDGWYATEPALTGAVTPVSGYVYVPWARSSRLVHAVQGLLAPDDDGLASGTNDNRVIAFRSDPTPYQVKALRIAAGSNTFNGGKLALLRRRMEYP